MLGAFRLNSLSAMISAGPSVVSATGGTTSTYALSGTNYRIHTFNTTGANNFVVTTGGNIDVLLVGGGGGGAVGGGGGGGVINQLNLAVTPQTYALSVGAGGTGSATTGADANPGSATTGFSLTADGGRGGSARNTAGVNSIGYGGASGAGSKSTAGTLAGGTANIGKAGGTGSYFSPQESGGGGGGGGSLGTAGGSGTGTKGGNGGAGSYVTDFHTTGTVYFGGGGGGATTASGGVSNGGQGGGGAGGGTSGTAGTANTGGGGGAGLGSVLTAWGGKDGGSGTIIVRYPLGAVPTTLSYVTEAYNGANATITIPSTAQAGDLAIFFNWAWNSTTTIPTYVLPSGWTEIGSASQGTTNGCYSIASYKVLTSTDPGSTITGTLGTTNNNYMMIYRPNGAIGTVTINAMTQQATAAAPTAQTLSLSSYKTALDLHFAQYCSTGSVTTPGSTVAATRLGWGGATQKINAFEGAVSGAGWSTTSTISESDYGVNALRTISLRIS